MANKYNTQLQSNNTDLQAILNTINELPEAGGGDTSMEDGLITGQATNYINNRVTSIGDYVFYNHTNLTTVSFPKVTSIGEYAFLNCRSLTTVSFPNATNIANDAFNWCINLTAVNFPNVISMGNNTFYYCINLATANFPVCTSVGTTAFSYCSNLTTVSFPNATYIGGSAFYKCSGLTTVSFPNVTIIDASVFYGCSGLTTVTFPKATSIYYAAFNNCTRLKSLYLTGSSVCQLGTSAAFTSTPIGGYSTIAGTYGSIFVPASLVSRYQTATNWTYFSSRISYYGIGLIDDNSIRINSTKTFTINTNFSTIPHDVSVVSQENDVISISNVSADLHNITFDVTAFNIDRDKEVIIIVSATDGNTVLQEYISLNIYHVIGDLTDNYIELNSTKTISIPLYYDEVLPSSVNIVSNDNSVLSVSNIQYDTENITCDITSYDTKKIENITVTAVYDGVTYEREFMIGIGLEPTYTIESLGTTYGFALNSNEYYESNNKGVNSSYAICKLNIDIPYNCTMYLDCINYGEANYDYGILSMLDTKLQLSATADSTNVYKSFKGSSSENIQTISYTVTTGVHFIYIKYIKDSSQNNGNDSLQFKVRFE